MGVNLAQVIDTTPTRALTKVSRKQLFEERRDIDTLRRYHRYNDRDTALAEAVTKHVTTGAKLAMEGHVLPRGVGAFDILTGKSTVRTARELADRIGFAILPWALTRGPYRPPHDAAEALKQWSAAGYGIYIMAPVHAYDLKDHVEHANYDGKPMFVPADARQAFMVLSMSIPVFRSLQEQINALSHQIRDSYDRLRAIERDVAQLGHRVNALAQEVTETRVQHARIEQEQRRARVIEWYNTVTDPLALILPSGATIENLDSPLLVGPAWGGDLPAEIVKLIAPKRGAKLLTAKPAAKR